MEKTGWLTTDQWAIVGAAGTAGQAVAALLALVAAVFAARYAAGQVRQARLQVEEAQKARLEQAAQARIQEKEAETREFQRRKELGERDERRQEELARPFVVVDFEPSLVFSNAINLVFENIGKTLAKNVRFTFEPPLESSQAGVEYQFKDSVLINKGIPAMPPGRRFEVIFDMSHERIKTELPMTYRVRVDSQDATGRDQEPLEYVLDLNFRYGHMQFEIKTIHHAAKSLREIEKIMGKWTQHFNGVRVWVRDEDAYLERQREEFESKRAAHEDLVARLKPQDAAEEAPETESLPAQ